MDNVNIRKEDQILMSLVHYFVTKENYAPIYVHGVKDEIWLEKVDGPYRVIRINNNYIHNDEQYKFDQFKISNILKQIKRKTFSFKINALNINLNEADRVNNIQMKDVDTISIHTLKEFENNKDVLEIFPNIKNNLFKDLNGLELVFNVTNDINKKTEDENKKYEKIFSPKKIVATYVLIALCILYFVVSLIISKGLYPTNYSVLVLGANYVELLKIGQVYRLITYAFLHGSISHLLINMYSLMIVGNQIESRFGKVKFLIIYFISAIVGGLLSAGVNTSISVGASGAIFGLMGALLYFCLSYRLYFKGAITNSILPVIIINLIFGFMSPGIDNACHIGGLIAGFLTAMGLGIPGSNKKADKINGWVLLTLFTIFLLYLVFFR